MAQCRVVTEIPRREGEGVEGVGVEEEDVDIEDEVRLTIEMKATMTMKMTSAWHVKSLKLGLGINNKVDIVDESGRNN